MIPSSCPVRPHPPLVKKEGHLCQMCNSLVALKTLLALHEELIQGRLLVRRSLEVLALGLEFVERLEDGLRWDRWGWSHSVFGECTCLLMHCRRAVHVCSLPWRSASDF